jgi:nucleotide-binding universal stress UspA family protein
MAIRTILAPLSGGSSSEGAIETACRLALRFGAHVDGLHVRADPTDALPLLGQDISTPVAAELIELAQREGEDNAIKARAVFDAAIARHGFPFRDKPLSAGQAAAGGTSAPLPSASWREEVGQAAAIVPQRARLNDLVVLGQSGRVTEKPHSDTLDETVVHGGRPVLLAPARALGPIGEIIAIAWNASPEAARAVSGALPFLVEARAVHILSVGKEDDSLSDAELATYLGWHGITAVAHHVPPVKGVKTGEALLASARDQGADLLVMGGYGHAPWREMIFGGATAQVVGSSRLPVLLSH